jgi:hypothetical protein
MPHDRLGDLPTLSHLCLSDLEEAAVFKKDPVQYMMRIGSYSIHMVSSVTSLRLGLVKHPAGRNVSCRLSFRSLDLHTQPRRIQASFSESLQIAAPVCTVLRRSISASIGGNMGRLRPKRDLRGIRKTATKAESVCKQNRAALVLACPDLMSCLP